MELFFKSSTRTTFAYLEEMDGKQLSQQRKIMEKQSYSSQCYQIPPGLLRYANVSAPMSSLRNMFSFWLFQARARTAMANEVKADRLRLNLQRASSTGFVSHWAEGQERDMKAYQCRIGGRARFWSDPLCVCHILHLALPSSSVLCLHMADGAWTGTFLLCFVGLL